MYLFTQSCIADIANVGAVYLARKKSSFLGIKLEKAHGVFEKACGLFPIWCRRKMYLPLRKKDKIYILGDLARNAAFAVL